MMLRKAKFTDLEFLFDVRNHPDVRAQCRQKQQLTMLAHRDWLDEMLTDETVQLFIAVEQSERVGYIRADKHQTVVTDWDANATTDCCWVELSYAIRPELHGKGYGSEMLAQAVTLLRSQGFTDIRAQVQPDNTPSATILESQGFARASESEWRLVTK